MLKFCPFCGELPIREPVKCKAGYYIECSGCGESTAVRKTIEEAWISWQFENPHDRYSED